MRMTIIININQVFQSASVFRMTEYQARLANLLMTEIMDQFTSIDRVPTRIMIQSVMPSSHRGHYAFVMPSASIMENFSCILFNNSRANPTARLLYQINKFDDDEQPGRNCRYRSIICVIALKHYL